MRQALKENRQLIEGGAATGQIALPQVNQVDIPINLQFEDDSELIEVNGVKQWVIRSKASDMTYVKNLRFHVDAALDDFQEPMKAALGPKAAQIEKDRLRLMRHMIRDEKVDGSGAPLDESVYVLRLVYDRGPHCDPILSEPTQPFKLARAVDPNAPARLVRIQAPSVRLQDLRKYAQGVGIQMSGDLNKVMNRVGPNLLKGEGLDTGGTGIAMVCTFSLQILFIIALVLVFVFAIVLNIVFWWLAFLRICLPIPKSN